MTKNRLALPISLWLIGAFFVVVDAVVFGKYTGEPNTYLGWIGIVFLCIVIFPLISNDTGDTGSC